MSKAAKRERQKQNRELARVERERMLKRQRQMKTLRTLLLLLAPIVVIAVIISLVNGGSSSDTKKSAPKAPTRTFAAPPPMTIDTTAKYTATMKTSEGTVTMDLDAATAPVATNNFVFLARNRFYDGLTIHRAAKNFVIQGGDPKGDGSGGPGYTVEGEVPTDHYPIGSLAAAKGGSDPAGTFGSQFFIVTGSGGATLPNDYARFGIVTAGLANAQKIEKLAPSSGDGAPTKKVTIIKVTIRENGTVLGSTTTTAPTTTTTVPASTSSSSTP